MALDNWQAQVCPRATCSLFGQKGQGNIRPRGWHGRRRDIRLLWCRSCGQRFSERRGTALFRSKLSTSKAVGIVEHVTEGCGIRPTSRLCRVDTGTVMRLLRGAGVQAKQLHDERVRGLTIAAIQLDEKRCVLQGRRLRLPVPRGRPEGPVRT